jgi:hypothetical protein
MKHIALDLALLPLAPLLIAQGRRVKRDTPRLPPAAGPLSGRVEGEGEPLRVLTIGESSRSPGVWREKVSHCAC